MRPGPLFFGIAMGLLAALAQEPLGLAPPEAYGICVVCHARDLVGSVARVLTGVDFPVAQVARSGAVLTTLGLLLGALLASRRHGEWVWLPDHRPLRSAVLGGLVALSGLLAAACPIRLFLRSAYGDLYAVAGVVALAIGVELANGVLTWGEWS